MVTEREEKLAAARKKLARFQQTKTKAPAELQPPTQSISRDGSEPVSAPAAQPTQPENGHQLMYSNPTPTFQSIQSTPQLGIDILSIWKYAYISKISQVPERILIEL